ncbi:CHAT domain-containing protein [Mycena venus]|uniref:CHAT domain-containing protein n=1 Tax=Mycena venus TaxID=2733690 RepID=A0A8H6X6C5_9AGAR|nr:CHAT domain-containing protein [Mycena venus]
MTPEDHPQFSDHLQNLGVAFSDRYRRLGDLQDLESAILHDSAALSLTPPDWGIYHLADLEAAITAEELALNSTPEGDTMVPKRLSAVAGEYLKRYQRLEKLDDLEQALNHHQAAVLIAPPDYPDRAGLLRGLFMGFTERYRRFGSLEDLDAAMENDQSARFLLSDRYAKSGNADDLEEAQKNTEVAMTLVPVGHPDQARQHQILGMIYASRYERSNNIKDLEATLEHMQVATELFPSDHIDLPTCLADLSASLGHRHNRFGDLHDLHAAVELGTRALDGTPAGHLDVLKISRTLALSLLERYKRLGTLADLETAQSITQAAISQTPAGHPDKPVLLQILAAVLGDQYRSSGNMVVLEEAVRMRLGDLEDLEAAVSNGHDAVTLALGDEAELPDFLDQFAACLTSRYRRFGNLQDLESALKNNEGALQKTPEDSPDLPYRLHSLAAALWVRLRRLGNLEDLEMGLQHNSKAIDSASMNDHFMAKYQHLQALYLMERYNKLRRQQDLHDALQSYQVAVDLTSPGHTTLPEMLRNFGEALLNKFLQTGALDDFHACLSKNQAALELIREGHPERPAYLNNVYRVEIVSYHMSRIVWSKHDLEQLDIALQHSFAAVQLSPPGHPDRPMFLQALARNLVHRYEELPDPKDMEAALLNYSISFQTYTSNPIAYTAAFNLLPEILWIGNPLKVRHEETRQIEIGKATANALRVCIAQGNLPLAVEFLEQGLATTFQQMLQLKTEFDSLPPNDANQLRQLSSLPYEQKSPNLLAIAAERNSLLLEIRKRPGFEYFLLSKPYKELRRAAKDGPVVILTSHTQHCDAIIIVESTSDPVHVPLPDVTVEQLEHHRGVLQDILQRGNSRIRQSEASRLFGAREWTISKPIDDCFRDMMSFLWNSVLQPIYKTLDSVRDF